ncbi:ABC transporter ATP-binding protein [Pseudobacteroides cellulosolvens]|uniref:ABC transporter related protein n=1 Tax=Pseudobacteroides cellulosolvens ATCC 35603 = DSM 2933 TaxID=398512 RepID=A0A0L6JNV6_9FIRM|nr:ABC transporter ATP-binding protein [Pseudobacteroides cellulosolvens]KNY27521.1 ABC transporter related protein [Pseudobacteroides cellulosolvens ATCC 35603 = DSM 2933]
MNAIEIENLTKYYGKSRGIIDVNLEVKEGEVFGFIGPNGAGKSTTIRTLLAFIFPDSGNAKILGMDCLKDQARIKMNIGYLPSEVNYYDDMNVRDLLLYSAKFYRKDCTKRINELSEILELDLNKKIDSLSYGNKKKVAVIQSLLHEPKLLILDEPTGGLDPLMQNRFFDILKYENKKGVTIFFSSHILSEVQKMCNRVAIVKEGRMLKVETIDRLRGEKHRKVMVELKNKDDILAVPGMRNLERNDNNIQFLYSGDINDLLKKLALLEIDNLWLEEPSLEEIFMHYYES